MLNRYLMKRFITVAEVADLVAFLFGPSATSAGNAGRWSNDLLSSALSRSDTPMGLPVLDGRTQDLVASAVLPQLVKDPAGLHRVHRRHAPRW
jgi:hypothetical protein